MHYRLHYYLPSACESVRGESRPVRKQALLCRCHILRSDTLPASRPSTTRSTVTPERHHIPSSSIMTTASLHNAHAFAPLNSHLGAPYSIPATTTEQTSPLDVDILGFIDTAILVSPPPREHAPAPQTTIDTMVTDMSRSDYDNESSVSLSCIVPVSHCSSRTRMTPSTQLSKRNREYVCTAPNCGKAFAKKWNLQAHERLHTGDKPFVCRLGCGERHMWMSSLKSHETRKCKLLPASKRFHRKTRTRKTIQKSRVSDRHNQQPASHPLNSTSSQSSSLASSFSSALTAEIPISPGGDINLAVASFANMVGSSTKAEQIVSELERFLTSSWMPLFFRLLRFHCQS